MKMTILAAATAALLASQVAPALAQATADERGDRNQSVKDEAGVRKDTSEIKSLNAQVRAVHMRMKHDHGAALAADRKELARLNGQETAARSNEASLNANNKSVQKDYHQDLGAKPKPH